MLSELKKALLMDKISFWIFTVTVLLLPFFFIPYAPMPVLVGKGTLLFIGVALSFCFWLVARLVDGKFKMPKSPLIWCGFGISFAFLVSSFFSPVFSVSFWGQGFETGTFVSIFSMFIGMFLTSVFFNQIKSNTFLVAGLFFSFVAGFFFMLMNFIAQLVHFNFWLKWTPVNTVGSWNDFAIFAGLIAVLALAAIEFLPTSRKWKKLSYVWLALSMLVMILVNFSQLWVVLGIFALFIFVYSMSIRENFDAKKSAVESEEDEKKIRGPFPAASFTVVVVCLFFILASNFFGGFLVKYVNIDNIDVRPGAGATLMVAKSSLPHNFVTGTGPNRFVDVWLQNKPDGVNSSLFWKADFNSGFGTIPSYLITTGILGFLLWLAFFFFFFKEGVTAMSLKTKNKLDKQVIFALFLASLFLWIFAVTYVPGIAVFFLAFVFTGLFIGLLASNKKPAAFYAFSFVNDPRNSFFAILAIVALVIVAITGGYKVSEKFYSTVLFEKASVSAYANDPVSIQRAEEMLLRAASINPQDSFFRALSSLYLARLNMIVSQNGAGALESAKQELQDNLKKAEDSAILAVKVNSKNYMNFVALGDVYYFVMPIGVAQAYENAKSSYEQALALNPKNPEIFIMLARLEVANKDNAKAEEYLNQALALKPNYMQAYLNLGFLKYQAGSYSASVPNFENAVVLDSSSFDARYALALAYSKLGRNDEAIAQIELLIKANPNEQSLQTMLAGLKASKQAPAPDESKDESSTKKPAAKR